MLAIRVIPLVGAEVRRMEVLVKDQKQLPPQLPDLQVGEVPRSPSVDDLRELHLVGFRICPGPELTQDVRYVARALGMPDPEDEELRRESLDERSGVLQGRNQRTAVLPTVAVFRFLEKVAHRGRASLL